MKKFITSAYSLLIAMAMTASCSTIGTAGNGASSAQTSQSKPSGSGLGNMLGGLLGDLVGNAIPLSEEAIQGTWKYSSPACKFDSESALAKAGGAVAATTAEEKLGNVYSKIGIKSGSCSYTFNADKTCVMKFGKRTIKGTWSLDAENRDLQIKATLFTLKAKAYYNTKELTLLFDADKLLNIVKVLSAFAGNLNSSIASVSGILDSYDGMQLGMNLKK